MKTNCKILAISMLFVLGWVFSLNAKIPDVSPIHFEHNRSWRLEEQLTQIDNNGAWEVHELTNHYYNASNPFSPDSTVFSYFEPYQGWVPATTDFFSYDSTGEYVTGILTKLTLTGESNPISRGIFVYDNDNHLTLAMQQVLGLDRQWTDVRRTHIFYNNGCLDKIVSWDEENWIAYEKAEFACDDEGRISMISEFVSDDSTSWFPSYQNTIWYHANDTTNGASLADLISHRYPQCMYYKLPLEIGMISEQVRQIWMYQYWQNDSRDVYSYDDDNHMLIHQKYHNTMVGEWMNETLDTCSYDNHGNMDTDLLQSWVEDTSEWENSQLVTCIWEQITAAEDNVVPAVPDLSAAAYPNPFKTDLNVQIRSKSNLPVKLELFNVKGQKVFEEVKAFGPNLVLDNKTLNDKAKSTGIYFLKVRQGNASTTRKILRVR